MDQDAFRSLLSAPRQGQAGPSSRGVLGGPAPKRGWGLKPKEGTYDKPKEDAPPAPSAPSAPEFAPRAHHRKVMQGKYKDRAEMRRQGVDDEYKGVEKLLEDFERKKAEAGDDADKIEATRAYLGGDAEHSILVKGLDYALLAARKAELAKEQEEGADDELEELGRGLGRDRQGGKDGREVKTEEKLGKGFKSIAQRKAEEAAAKGEKKKKKKKKLAQPDDAGGSGQAPIPAVKAKPEKVAAEASEKRNTIDLAVSSKIGPASTPKQPSPSAVEEEEDDIFADVGTYDLGSEQGSEDEDEDVVDVEKERDHGATSEGQAVDDGERRRRDGEVRRGREENSRSRSSDRYGDRYDIDRDRREGEYRRDRRGSRGYGRYDDRRGGYGRTESPHGYGDRDRYITGTQSRTPRDRTERYRGDRYRQSLRSRSRSESPYRRHRDRSPGRGEYENGRNRYDRWRDAYSPSPPRRRSPSPRRRSPSSHHRLPSPYRQSAKRRSPSPSSNSPLPAGSPARKRPRSRSRSPTPSLLFAPPIRSRSPSASDSEGDDAPVRIPTKLVPLASSAIADVSSFLAADASAAKAEERRLKKAQWRARQGLAMQEGVDASMLEDKHKALSEKQKANRQYQLVMNRVGKGTGGEGSGEGAGGGGQD